jgi:hypothetical protein
LLRAAILPTFPELLKLIAVPVRPVFNAPIFSAPTFAALSNPVVRLPTFPELVKLVIPFTQLLPQLPNLVFLRCKCNGTGARGHPRYIAFKARQETGSREARVRRTARLGKEVSRQRLLDSLTDKTFCKEERKKTDKAGGRALLRKTILPSTITNPKET